MVLDHSVNPENEKTRRDDGEPDDEPSDCDFSVLERAA